MEVNRLSLLAAIAFSVCAQNPPQAMQDRVFSFKNAQSNQQIQEIATVIRSAGEIREVSVDEVQRTMTVQALADRMAFAAWLFEQLDRPASELPALQKTRPAYQLPDEKEGLARVYYIAHADSVRQFQEAATAVRSIVELRYAFTYSGLNALVVRVDPGRAPLVDWLIARIEQPGQAAVAPFELAADDFTQVLYVKNADSVQTFQEGATAIRSAVGIRRLYTYNSRNAIFLRGTAAQLAMAEWLDGRLDRVPMEPRSAAVDYRAPGTDDEVTRVYYLKPTLSVAEFQQNVTSMRRETMIPRVFTFNPLRAVVVRAAPKELEVADRLLAQ
jgi:hypothetical protein